MSLPVYVEQSLRSVYLAHSWIESLRKIVADGERAAGQLPEALKALEEAKAKHAANVEQMASLDEKEAEEIQKEDDEPSRDAVVDAYLVSFDSMNAWLSNGSRTLGADGRSKQD